MKKDSFYPIFKKILSIKIDFFKADSEGEKGIYINSGFRKKVR